MEGGYRARMRRAVEVAVMATITQSVSVDAVAAPKPASSVTEQADTGIERRQKQIFYEAFTRFNLATQAVFTDGLKKATDIPLVEQQVVEWQKSFLHLSQVLRKPMHDRDFYDAARDAVLKNIHMILGSSLQDPHTGLTLPVISILSHTDECLDGMLFAWYIDHPDMIRDFDRALMTPPAPHRSVLTRDEIVRFMYCSVPTPGIFDPDDMLQRLHALGRSDIHRGELLRTFGRIRDVYIDQGVYDRFQYLQRLEYLQQIQQ